jgi:hypothetical protein
VARSVRHCSFGTTVRRHTATQTRFLIEFLCYPRDGTLACDSDAEDVSWARTDDLQRFGLTETTLGVIHAAVRIKQSAM